MLEVTGICSRGQYSYQCLFSSYSGRNSCFIVCYCHIGVFESDLQLICVVAHQVKCVILVDWKLCCDLCGVTNGLKLSSADVAVLGT